RDARQLRNRFAMLVARSAVARTAALRAAVSRTWTVFEGSFRACLVSGAAGTRAAALRATIAVLCRGKGGMRHPDRRCHRRRRGNHLLHDFAPNAHDCAIEKSHFGGPNQLSIPNGLNIN